MVGPESLLPPESLVSWAVESISDLPNHAHTCKVNGTVQMAGHNNSSSFPLYAVSLDLIITKALSHYLYKGCFLEQEEEEPRDHGSTVPPVL